MKWSKPSSVPDGTVLGSKQLNASANVPGTFTYTPAAGTVLRAGTQTLNAVFTPQDRILYATANATTTIDVTGKSTTPTLDSISLSETSVALATGGNVQIAAAAHYSDNSTKDVTSSATWSSSNTKVATVVGGKVTGVSAGTAQLTASWNGTTSPSTTVTVTAAAPELTSIRISGGSSVQTGSSLQLTATATYSDNSTKDVTGSATWSSSNTKVVTVAGGKVTGVTAGTAQLTASWNGTTSPSAPVTVTAATPKLTSIRISGGSSVQTGSILQLAATATYSDNSTKDVTGSASWNSSNTKVATVAGGKVTGVTAGTAQLTASWSNMQAPSSTISVTAPAPSLTKLQVTGSSTVTAGDKIQLKATGTYSDQSTKDLTSSATWSSSDASVAVVQSGTISGVNPGTASISAAIDGQSCSTSITVTSKYAVQIDPSMSMTQIQDAINGSQPGDTIAFAAGTYKLSYPALRLQPGRTYLGSTSGATILSGSGGFDLMTFYGDGLTLQNFNFDGGGLYLGGPVSNVKVENNAFENIGAPYANWTTEIAIFIDTSAANSDFSHNSFKNLGGSLLTEFVDESFSTGIFGYGLSNVTIEYNTFDTFNEGIHIFYNSLDGKNVAIDYNTFVRGHRIAIEQQNSAAGGLEVAFNKISEPLNAWALTYGISMAATSVSGTGILVHDNLVNGDTPVGAGCQGSGCYYPYGIEAWGTGTQIYNNTIEGLWNHGVAIGVALNLSVKSNTICGPNMAANNAFVDFEYGSEPGTVISGNTTSSAMTCGAGN